MSKNGTAVQKSLQQEVIELLSQLSPQKMKKATDYLSKLQEADQEMVTDPQVLTRSGGNMI